MVILGALGDDAGNAAIAVLFQLGQAGLEVYIVAQLLNVLQQQLITSQTRLAFACHVVVLLHREEVVGVVLRVLCGHAASLPEVKSHTQPYLSSRMLRMKSCIAADSLIRS